VTTTEKKDAGLVAIPAEDASRGTSQPPILVRGTLCM
jgi:hypothetical protein